MRVAIDFYSRDIAMMQYVQTKERKIMNKIKKIVSLLSLLVVGITFGMEKQQEWRQIRLPNVFRVPETNVLELDGKLVESRKNQYEFKTDALKYKLTMPASANFPDGLQWFGDEKKCREKLGTTGTYPKSQQTVLRSDYIKSISGFSFRGRLIHDTTNGSRYNHYAIFFHQQECYDGGPEYGFVFFEDMNEALFYVCGNCNQTAQKWWDWPGKNLRNQNVKDSSNKVALALKNPDQYREWKIIVTQDGNFLIELSNPETDEKVSCTIKKPSWLENLYEAPGYITLNVKRDKNNVKDTRPDATPGYLEVDTVKIPE